MIPRRCLRVFPALVLAAVAGAAPTARAQAPVWVSTVKSAPQDYRERVILLRGDAVEVLGASPASTHGLYRLVDASDPSGVLVRSTNLPTHSGPFEVEARVAPELLSGGSLLLDEIHRQTRFRLVRFLPTAAAAAGGLGALIFLGLYLQAKRAEHHHRLEPPIWLIPTGPEPPPAWDDAMGTEGRGSPHHFDYRLHYVVEQQGQALALASRRMGRGLLVAGVVAVGGGGWYLATREEAADRPMFALLIPETTRPPVITDTAPATEPEPTAGTDSLVLRVGGEESPPPSRRRSGDAQREPRPRADTTARVGPTPLGVRAPVVDSAATQPTPRVVEPLPPPPPPPVTVARRDTAPGTRPPDPEAEKRAARSVLEQAVARFVAAAGTRQMDDLEALYPPGGNPTWRSRFLEDVRNFAPTASRGALDQVVLTESGAEVAFTVSFRWRANFGVERRKNARFVAAVQRAGPAWGFVGVRLLESFP